MLTFIAAYMMQQEAQDDYMAIEQEWVFQNCYALVCILLENSKLEMVEALMKTLKEVCLVLIYLPIQWFGFSRC